MPHLLMQLGRHMGKLLFSVCVQVFHGGSFTSGHVCDLHNSHFFVHTCLLCVWKEGETEGGREGEILCSVSLVLFFFSPLALL